MLSSLSSVSDAQYVHQLHDISADCLPSGVHILTFLVLLLYWLWLPLRPRGEVSPASSRPLLAAMGNLGKNLSYLGENYGF